MTTNLMPMPKFRAFDANGAPLAGGKVYTYEAGTSTPLASYTDYSGNTANTNPVELDANGEANIWLGQQLYKIVLRDGNDVLQWTVDNVGQNSLADLSAGFGQATDIASATTVDLGTIATHFANITGTTTITSFGSSAQLTAPIYLVKFNGALMLTNSANLITQTGANITTATNDRAFVEYLGSGAWRIISYMKADGGVIGGVLPIALGGTGQTAKTAAFNALSPNTTKGDITKYDGTNNVRLAVGSSTQVVGVASGEPAWVNGPGWAYESAETAITTSSTLTFTHGLTYIPRDVQVVMRCKTAQYGWNVGDEVIISSHGLFYNEGLCVGMSTTNVWVIVATAISVFHKGTFNYSNITTGNWRIVVRAR